MPNLRAGFVITASLPASMVLFTSELLAEGVAPIPLDGCTVVEQTVSSTIVDPSSGNGATPSTSSSDANKVIDAGNQAIVVKHALKSGIMGLALRRAPS